MTAAAVQYKVRSIPAILEPRGRIAGGILMAYITNIRLAEVVKAVSVKVCSRFKVWVIPRIVAVIAAYIGHLKMPRVLAADRYAMIGSRRLVRMTGGAGGGIAAANGVLNRC